MSDADWDADDFEPEDASAKLSKTPATDKWDGEDEDDDKTKDAWDKSDSEGDADGEPAQKAVQRKKKKKLADIIAEKEAAKAAELEARAAEAAAKKQLDTPEARLAEKLRLQKLEENANLQLAKDMLGVKSGSIDSCIPVTKEEFDSFSKQLCEKITSYASSDYYNDFIEDFVRNLCLDLNPTTLKKIKMNTEALHSNKLKEEKALKAKKAKGAKGGSLRMDTSKDMFSVTAAGYDDIDDFM